MSKSPPYNPLNKDNLARSIEIELLSRPVEPLAAVDHIRGAGVYAIYYNGSFAPYETVATANRDNNFTLPIYVGKAIPKGGRKGGLSKDASSGRALADRLKQHGASIHESENLEVANFHLRHLVVDDIWIPLGENMLIETFKPVWNRAIDGFGNKDPGRRRAAQFKSPWDVLHPGRKFAAKLGDGGLTVEFLLKRVSDYFAGKQLDKYPKPIADEQAAIQADAEDTVDEV